MEFWRTHEPNSEHNTRGNIKVTSSLHMDTVAALNFKISRMSLVTGLSHPL